MLFHKLTSLSVALAVLAMLCVAAPAIAQMDGSTGTLTTAGNMPEIPSNNLVPTASISGSILTQDGYPLDNARVELRNNMGITVAYGYTGPSGHFEVTVPDGTYRLVATSGLSQTSEQVHVSGVNAPVSLRMPHTRGSQAGPATVSIAALRVPGKAKDELRKAREEMSKNHSKRAQKHIDKALKIYPHYSEALALDGVLAMSRQDFSKASNQLSEAVKWDSNNANAYIIMGSLFNLQKRYDDALRELNRGIALNPVSWQGHLELAKANLGKSEFATALREATKAQQLTPVDFAPMHLVKGNAFLGMQDYPSAVREFQKYLSENKNGDKSIVAQVQQRIEQIKALSARAER